MNWSGVGLGVVVFGSLPPHVNLTLLSLQARAEERITVRCASIKQGDQHSHSRV
jgi:hypothetical protein